MSMISIYGVKHNSVMNTITIVDTEALKISFREFPGGPVVRTPCCQGQVPDSVPSRGTKIPQFTLVKKTV